MPQMPRMLTRRFSVSIAVTGVLLTSACASNVGRREHRSSSAVDRHASTAGNVMSSGRGPLPTRAAALGVTGHSQAADSATTITALAAHGTTWNGSVVLRIVVETSDGLGASHRSSACFDYLFRYPRTTDSGVPQAVACQHRQPINLRQPPLPKGISVSTKRTVASVMAHAVTATPFTAALARRDLTQALGSDYTYDVGPEPHEPGTLDGFVRYGEQCLKVHVNDGVSDVTGPFTGDTCFGG